jgi:predicted ester cyclase
MVITIEDIIAEGDKVAARLTAQGTHLGSLGDIAPTGRQATWTGMRVFRMVDGKIAEHWANWDDVSLGRQLGILPPLS